MTDDEVAQLLVEWMRSRGGLATDDDFDNLAAVLEEHLPDPESATLEEARRVLDLPSMPKERR